MAMLLLSVAPCRVATSVSNVCVVAHASAHRSEDDLLGVGANKVGHTLPRQLHRLLALPAVQVRAAVRVAELLDEERQHGVEDARVYRSRRLQHAAQSVKVAPRAVALASAPAYQGTAACRSSTRPSSRQAVGRRPLVPRGPAPRQSRASPERRHSSPEAADARERWSGWRVAQQHDSPRRDARATERDRYQGAQRRSAKLGQRARTCDTTAGASTRELAPRSARATLEQRRRRCMCRV